MTAYIGSGPYCYANALCASVGAGWSPALVETLSGSAFGFQEIGPVPLFDPAGWDPDIGLDQALQLLGWDCAREGFEGAGAAMERLEELCAAGPVFVGPLEMGLLSHQPGSDRPIGADHFVTVLASDAEGVTMHDPQGHPYAWLPREAFAAAWGSATLGYGGRFPLRTGFERLVDRSTDQALEDLLPLAHRWASSGDGHQFNANSAGLRDLAEAAAGGLGEPGLPVLATFSLRLGARRRVDAAHLLAHVPEVAGALDAQARVLGRAQLAAVRADGPALASAFHQVADLHEELVGALQRATTTGSAHG